MSSFDGNLNSKYFEAANIDDTQKPRTRVTALVENEADVSFWYVIFKKYLPGREVFINPSTQGNSTRGKEAVLALKDGAGEYLLLCVDSDYDFLIPDADPDAAAINENPYIFQTYTYSIENYRCFAPSLDCVCVDASLNSEVNFDFVQFLQKYSECIYDLFLYSVYSKKKKIDMVLREDFEEHAIIGGKPNLRNNGEKTLDKLRNRVQEIVNCLDKANSEKRNMKEEIQRLASILQESELQIGRSNCYLFIHGHTLQKVVLSTLNKLIPKLIGKKLGQYREEAQKTQKAKKQENVDIDANELYEQKKSEYEKIIVPKIKKTKKRQNMDNDTSETDEKKNLEDEEIIAVAKLLLDTNKAYLYHDCLPLKCIERDIKRYLERYPISP